MLSPEGIVINAHSDYTENGTALFRVDCFTEVNRFVKEFDTSVRAFRDGVEIDDTGLVGTGCIVPSYDLKDELVLMVVGDIDGDGAATATDCAVIKSCIVGYRTPAFVESIVLDLDGNGVLSSSDYLTEVMRTKLGK